jgi:hypothetical protein
MRRLSLTRASRSQTPFGNAIRGGNSIARGGQTVHLDQRYTSTCDWNKVNPATSSVVSPSTGNRVAATRHSQMEPPARLGLGNEEKWKRWAESVARTGRVRPYRGNRMRPTFRSGQVEGYSGRLSYLFCRAVMPSSHERPLFDNSASSLR